MTKFTNEEYNSHLLLLHKDLKSEPEINLFWELIRVQTKEGDWNFSNYCFPSVNFRKIPIDKEKRLTDDFYFWNKGDTLICPLDIDFT